MKKVKTSQLFDAGDLLGLTAHNMTGSLSKDTVGVCVHNEDGSWEVEVILYNSFNCPITKKTVFYPESESHIFSRKADAVKLVKSFGHLYF